MSVSEPYIYRDVVRGDRLSLGLAHPRRHVLRQLRDRIQEIIAAGLIPTRGRLLDYGCGDMPYRPLLEPLVAEYIGADFPGNSRAEITVAPNGKIEAPNASFDCVLSTQVLEHVEDPRVYLAEAHRVLHAKGVLLLSTHGFWQYHPDPCDYWRWTKDGLELEIARAGLSMLIMRSVLGKASCAVQLWQDATSVYLPSRLKPAYYLALQGVIGLIERARPQQLSLDASVYVVVAQKQ